MSAEKGWIADPQPSVEWHTPGWVKTGGQHFVADRVVDAEEKRDAQRQR
jgi:hypothetical protein